MTSVTQKIKTMSIAAIAGLSFVGCTAAQDDVGLTPPTADYRPTGIENPGINGAGMNRVGMMNPPSMVNPPMANPLPSPIINNTIPDDEDMRSPRGSQEPLIPNNPNLTPSNIIELQVTGTGVAPQNAISPAQSTALAKRAAMIDAYKLLGEKMYGVKLNGQDTVENMAITSSTVKSKVQALVRGADITNVDCRAGLCQVTMEIKLDGRVWYRALGGR
ncbi:lipoprotein [Helicobacter fennelliae]|nr:hypothetical protein [Helicobacter fennelliae]SQB98039.1 lipoprotein [Helicobacter fennelliae]STP06750.1 lipoprotein [Helicobacter fennelliae]STQ83693.1 lipoprotein [Helicobacter fennelliae]